MTAVRLHLFLGSALVAAAGCAQQPVRADYTAPAAMTAPSPTITTASTQALTRAFPPPLLVFAYEQGWRQVVVSGNDHYFCRSDAPSGSLIPSHRCITQSELDFIRLTVEQQREQLTKPIPNDRST